jgi:hypothetical protein
LIEPEEAQETLKSVMNCFQNNWLNEDERMSILLTCVQAAMRETLQQAKVEGYVTDEDQGIEREAPDEG